MSRATRDPEDVLLESLLQGIEASRRQLGAFVDFLSADLHEYDDHSSYLSRVYFRCEVHQLIPDDIVDACNFDLVAQIGYRMAVQLARSIRKVVLETSLGSPGPTISGVRLDSSVPEGIMLVHPRTFYELMETREGGDNYGPSNR